MVISLKYLFVKIKYIFSDVIYNIYNNYIYNLIFCFEISNIFCMTFIVSIYQPIHLNLTIFRKTMIIYIYN